MIHQMRLSVVVVALGTFPKNEKSKQVEDPRLLQRSLYIPAICGRNQDCSANASMQATGGAPQYGGSQWGRESISTGVWCDTGVLRDGFSDPNFALRHLSGTAEISRKL